MAKAAKATEDPTVGRIVHWVTDDGVHRAAIVSEVLNGGAGIGVDSISVCVVDTRARGLVFLDAVAQDERTHAPGTWHWPERVE